MTFWRSWMPYSFSAISMNFPHIFMKCFESILVIQFTWMFWVLSLLNPDLTPMEIFFFPVLKTAKDFRHHFPTQSENKALLKRTPHTKKTTTINRFSPKRRVLFENQSCLFGLFWVWFIFGLKYKLNRAPGQVLCLALLFLINTLNLFTRELESLQNSWTVVALGVPQLNLPHPASEGVPVLSVLMSPLLLQGTVSPVVLTQLVWGHGLARCGDLDEIPAFLGGRGCSATVRGAVPEAAALAQDEPSWGAPRGQGMTGACFPGFTCEQEKRCFVMPSPQGRSHWPPGRVGCKHSPGECCKGFFLRWLQWPLEQPRIWEP